MEVSNIENSKLLGLIMYLNEILLIIRESDIESDNLFPHFNDSKNVAGSNLYQTIPHLLITASAEKAMSENSCRLKRHA